MAGVSRRMMIVYIRYGVPTNVYAELHILCSINHAIRRSVSHMQSLCCLFFPYSVTVEHWQCQSHFKDSRLTVPHVSAASKS